MPGQAAEEVEDSIRLAADLGIRVSVAEYSPVPLSALWEKSAQMSRFPLTEEPLTHNNTILPLQWERFTLEDLERLKVLARNLSLKSLVEND